MVVDRRHQEDAAPEALEGEDLNGDRERLDHEDAADDDQQDLGLGHDREAGDRSAEAERAGVAHEDRGRERVEPEEPDAAADQADREQGEVVLTDRDVGDSRVGKQDDCARARRQPVETVGQVHPVCRTGKHQEDEDEVRDGTDVPGQVGDPEVDHGFESDLVAGHPPEDQGERDLAEQLVPAGEPE